jgi:hypothetical protein
MATILLWVTAPIVYHLMSSFPERAAAKSIFGVLRKMQMKVGILETLAVYKNGFTWQINMKFGLNLTLRKLQSDGINNAKF